MNHLIPLPYTDRISIDIKGYVYGLWPSRKVKKEIIHYVTEDKKMIKINVPLLLSLVIKPTIKDDFIYYKNQRRNNLLKLDNDSLLNKLNQVKLEAGKNRHFLSEEEIYSIYIELDGLFIEEELKKRNVSFKGYE